MENYQKFIISLLVPFVAGGIGSFFTYPEIESWYASLSKPSFNPPIGFLVQYGLYFTY